MTFKKIPLDRLLVNRANDRHGELENETAAIAWLFKEREQHMRNLTKDIVERGEIFELPLVSPENDNFVVYDGNRRVTCLKLLADPRRAPTTELQDFFRDQRTRWKGAFLVFLECQVEPDRDRIDEILYRRHTGTQNGVGQSTWDDRMKATFIARTGKGNGPSVADEIEKHLTEAGLLPPRRKIPRSTLNRLLSAEPLRYRVGITMKSGRFDFTHNKQKTLGALSRIANDLATRKIVLGDIWDVAGKEDYLKILEAEGVLPTPKDKISIDGGTKGAPASASPRPSRAPKPVERTTLIPQKEFGITWSGDLQRHHQIWEELQFFLELKRHPNAISVLFRVLLELSLENYITKSGVAVHENDKLSARLEKVGQNLYSKGKIDKKYMGLISKFQRGDQLVSSDTLNRYVHSPNFAPSSQHLTSMWDSLANVIVLCLKS